MQRGNGSGRRMQWELHWLEAEGDRGPWRDHIAAEIEATRQLVARATTPPRLDILVQRPAGAVIPEIGMVGHAHGKKLFALTMDPDNPHFAAGLHDGTLRRQVAHEVHHCLRMAGPSYGWTLVDALVSEGLAGRFTGWLFGSPAEQWECATGAEALRAHAPDEAMLRATGYAHAGWFFGAGGGRPRWLGYTPGYQIVGDWLTTAGEVDGNVWVNVPADAVLAAARGQFSALLR